MKNLFIYVDFSFSFNFGHYFNIFTNIFEMCERKGVELCLVHDYWKYHSANDDSNFSDYNLRRIQASEKNYVDKILSKIPLNQYDSITLYIYKGKIDYVESLCKLEKEFKERNIKFKIINTLFIIPFDQLDIVANKFYSDFENEIHKQSAILNDCNIELVFDVENSVWNKYLSNVNYLPPPLLAHGELQRKNTSSGNLVIGFDVWNLIHAPKYRNEDLDHIIKLVNFLVDNYPDIKIKIKIADSSYKIDDRVDKIFFHPNVEIIRFLSPEEYENYLKSCNIYILQYAPHYYKNKSSGHFIELKWPEDLFL